MYYNVTSVANVTGFLEFTQNVNSELMRGFYGTEILIIVVVIAFIGFLTYNPDPRPAFIGASFISVIISLGLLTVELIKPLAFWICVLVLAISLIIPHR